MKVEEKKKAQKRFNRVCELITENHRFRNKFFSEVSEEYILMKYQMLPYQARFVMVSFNKQTGKIVVEAWEKTFENSSFILKYEIDPSFSQMAPDLYIYTIEPVVKRLLGH